MGRQTEIAEVMRLLGGDTRLLTLYGTGGCGKTRLALATAQGLLESYEDGVWWVELASISDPDLVAGALASALGVREVPGVPMRQVLTEHLESRKVLLVLDNCEHLVDGCATLADKLLRSCPNLKILATSREPLRVEGETIWMVPSLSVPDSQRLLPIDELAGYEAVRLFVERARATVVGFELSGQNALAMAQLCRRLDGIPLAIELAAARVRALTVEQILERLENPLSLLTTGSRTAAPRHQTLRATLGWSYELLSESERKLFERLSVFSGGWDLEAAEAVGSGEMVEAGMVMDLLSNLVDKSLVKVEKSREDVASRYRMLEPVRQFGREKLRESQEEPEARRRHAGHYLTFAETAELGLLGPDQGRWLRRLRIELGNLREALAWSVEPGQKGAEHVQEEVRLRLAAALWRFWGAEGFEEGKRWLRTALERDSGGFPAIRAKALRGLGYILFFQQDYARAIPALEEAIALYKDLGDEMGTAFALANYGYAVLHGGYRERVRAFVEEGEALMRADLEGHPRAFLRIILAHAAMEEDDLDSAVSQLEEGLAMCRELGDLRNTSMSLFLLGMIELKRGDLDQGTELLDEGARIARELQGRLGGAYYGLGMGKVNAMRGRPVRAAKLWGAAEALREQMGMYLSQFDLAHSGYERDLAAVRSTLSEAYFETTWNEGRAMTSEETFEYALGEVKNLASQPTMTTTAATPVAPEPQAASSETHAPKDEPAVATARLRVFALGAARVEKEGEPLASSQDWIQKPKELLYFLLSHPEGRTKEQIGLALWPDASTSQLRSSFHDTVFRLRRALGAKEWISYSKGRYAFGLTLAYSYDVEEFEENLSEARKLRSHSPEQAIDHLRRAADLYGGNFLEDSADGEWVMEIQLKLRREYQEALMLLGKLLYAQDRHAEAAEAYRKAIAHDELLEEAHRELMRSHAALGERGRALRHYERLVGILEERLGVSPAPETTMFYERLRAGAEI